MSTIPHTQPSRNSRTAATPATVAAYIDEGHTQIEAARFFGLSERTVRNRLAEHRLSQAAAPVAIETSPRTRKVRRAMRPHHVYTRPAPPSGTYVLKRFVPIAPHLVAGSHTNWCAWDGELRPVVVGTTGAAWNAEQKRLQQAATQRRQPATEAATSVPDMPPVERDLPEIAAITQPLPTIAAAHNAEASISIKDDYVRQRVVAHPARGGLDLEQLVEVLTYQVGPVPIVAWLVFLVFLWLMAR